MTDADALLAAIIAAPDDDLPRLVYADWLDDHDQPDRAEFIRVQIQFARLLAREKRARPGRVVEARALQLLEQHRAAWLHPLGHTAHHVQFRRGFAEVISTFPAQLFTLRNGLFQVHPIRELEVAHDHLGRPERLTPEMTAELASWPELARIRALHLTSNAVGDAGVLALARSPHGGNLRLLALSSNGIGDAGVRAIVHSPILRNLTHLYLAFNPLGSDALRALARSPLLGSLRVLSLVGVNVEADRKAVGEIEEKLGNGLITAV